MKSPGIARLERGIVWLARLATGILLLVALYVFSIGPAYQMAHNRSIRRPDAYIATWELYYDVYGPLYRVRENAPQSVQRFFIAYQSFWIPAPVPVVREDPYAAAN